MVEINSEPLFWGKYAICLLPNGSGPSASYRTLPRDMGIYTV